MPTGYKYVHAPAVILPAATASAVRGRISPPSQVCRDIGREVAFAIQFASREVPAAAGHSAQRARTWFVPEVHEHGRWSGFQRPTSLGAEKPFSPAGPLGV